MNKHFSFTGVRASELLLVFAGVMTAAAIALLLVRIHATQTLKSEYLLLAQEVPALKTRINIRQTHIEAERIIGTEARSRLEEQAATFVLPATPDRARIIRIFTDTAGIVRSDAMPFTVTAVTISDADSPVITLRANGSFSALARLLAIVQFGGYMTVGDVLGEHAGEFMGILQDQAPLALPSAEEFLRIDLLAYALEPDIAEQNFLRNVPDTIAPDIRTLLLDEGLSDVRLSLTPHAKRLRELKLWPLPYTTLQSVIVEDESIVVQFGFPEKS